MTEGIRLTKDPSKLLNIFYSNHSTLSNSVVCINIRTRRKEATERENIDKGKSFRKLKIRDELIDCFWLFRCMRNSTVL